MEFVKGDLVALSAGPHAVVGRYQGIRPHDLHAVVRTHFDGSYHVPLDHVQHATEQQIDNAIKCDLEALRDVNMVWRVQDGALRPLFSLGF